MFHNEGYQINSLKEEIGTPDYYVLKGTEEFYVKVIKSNEGLRVSNMKWIINHPHEKVLIIYFTQKIQGGDYKKMMRKEMKEREKYSEKTEKKAYQFLLLTSLLYLLIQSQYYQIVFL